MSAVAERVEARTGVASSSGGGGKKAAVKAAKRSDAQHTTTKPRKSKLHEAKKALEAKELKKAAITHYYKTGVPVKPSKKGLKKRIKALRS